MYYIAVVMGQPSYLGEFEQIVLLAILRLHDEAYGVAIGAEIEACARRKTTPGALYTTLERLERKQLVTARSGAPTPERGGRAKRFYSVTAAGHRQLADAQRAFHRLLNGLDLLGENHG